MDALTSLPPEVLQEIFLYAHDPRMQHRPFEDYESYEAPLRRLELKAPNLRKNLCSLRLVNRALCQAVTPLLFRHIVISVESGIDRFLALSKSPLCRLVIRLELGARARWVHDGRGYLQDNRIAKGECLAYMTRLAIVIHSALPRFSEIHSLKLDFPEISYADNWEKDTADFFESMATAVRKSQLDKLDELHIWLPLAFDFGHFLDDNDATGHSTGSLFKRLAYLDLHYEGSTDEHQGLEFRSHQPNIEYTKYLHQLLSLAPNVHTLWVEGDDLLLNHSAISPSLRLKSLDLQWLSINASTLTAIVRQSIETLQRVVMRGIYLESGTWQEILSAMSELRLLVDFFIETCGYLQESRAAHYRPSIGPSANGPSYDPKYYFFIETIRRRDINTLRDVLVRMHKNKRRLHGDSYLAPAGLEGEAQMGDIELRAKVLRAYYRNRHCIEGTESGESEDESEDELFAFD
ncbi:hypothetical protein CDV31_016589 [Fusarium ambrosium]|uniref:Uncharacterized protein n=1 Tax=Fusarium ambrosium TaxID=131363 RepID=A0A428S5Y8_9HYPO|nr:hypothetical protein CDV31_016589 [Fusarium ambrosium]